MNNKKLYMTDSLFLRSFLCIYVVVIEVFQLLWMYLLSPISDKYVTTLQDPLAIISLCLTIAYTIAFIVLSFFSLEKNWKSYFIHSGIILVIGTIFSAISSYLYNQSLYEAGMLGNDNIVSWLIPHIISSSLANILPAILCFLMLTEKRVFKYIFIACFTILIFLNILSIIPDIQSAVESSDGRMVTIGGTVLEDWCEPFYDITNAINGIPTFTLAILILAFFIKVKKQPMVRPVVPTNVAHAVPLVSTPNHTSQPTTIENTNNINHPIDANVKYCTKCGAKSLSTSKFCDKCGNKFGQ